MLISWCIVAFTVEAMVLLPLRMKLLCIELSSINSALIPISISQYRYNKYFITFLQPRNALKIKELVKY